VSIVKSLSVRDGDMFYIDHNSDSFTIIDCCLSEDNKTYIVDEIKSLVAKKGIIRFISTHPDEDHIRGLKYLDTTIGIPNFYCVYNDVTGDEDDEDFTKYCELRDSCQKAYHLYSGCSRKWLNESDETRKSAGINFYWPDITNGVFKGALDQANNGNNINNISPIFTYSIQEGVTIMWMGDLEKGFMDNIQTKLPMAHILFAPHHGRDTGKVPDRLLEMINPNIIIIGEAPSEDLNYYAGYNTITQNSAGDITFDCTNSKVHIYVSEKNYKVDFLDDEEMMSFDYYLGTLNL
jgi:beta-lactamase superfamily II metal-dependent hydrolase